MVEYYVSTFAIVVLTLDRLFVILRPMSSVSKGKKYRYGLGVSAWVFGLVLGIQYAVHMKYDDEESYCSHEFSYTEVSFGYLNLYLVFNMQFI